MNEEDFQNLFLAYARTKGFADVERALTQRIGEQNDMALTNRLEKTKALVEKIFLANNKDPAVYTDAFDKLNTWINNSLDMYKAELNRVLYPMFVHCYLKVVERDGGELASNMMSRYRRRLIDMAGRLSRARAQELQELSGVAVKQHLDTNVFARKVSGSRQTVRMSSYACELLMQFLHSSPRLMELLTLVNEHITFECAEGRPTAPGEEGEEGADGSAYDGGSSMITGDVTSTNQEPVQLGLLKDNIEDLYEQAEEAKTQEAAGGQAAAAAATADATAAGAATAEGGDAAAAAAAPGPGSESAAAAAGGAGQGEAGDAAGQAGQQQGQAADAAAAGAGGAEAAGKAKAKKGGTGAAAGAAGAKGSKRELGERVEPRAWTPAISDDVKQEWLTDIGARADVSRAAQPSCCLFTFVNTRQTLTCASFARDVSRVAAGFADSSVRVYDVARLASGAGSGAAAAAGKAGARGQQRQQRGGAAPMDVDGSSSGRWPDDDEDDDAARQPAVAHLTGHTGPVHAVDFTHDGRCVLSASADGTVRMWACELSAPIAAYRGHMLPVWDVAACPLGYMFATGSADRTARVYCQDSTRCARILSGHQADVDLVRWHPNTFYVATASSDRTVRLWDVQTGACVRFMTGQASAPTALAMSPDGKQAAVGWEDGSIVIWDLGSAKRVAAHAGAHGGPVWSLAYSNGDGSLLASGGADEVVRLWSNDTLESIGASAAAGAAGGDGASADAAAVADGQAAAAAAATPAAGGPAAAAAGYNAIKSFATKSTAVTQLQFSSRNLLLAAGSFQLKGR